MVQRPTTLTTTNTTSTSISTCENSKNISRVPIMWLEAPLSIYHVLVVDALKECPVNKEYSLSISTSALLMMGALSLSTCPVQRENSLKSRCKLLHLYRSCCLLLLLLLLLLLTLPSMVPKPLTSEALHSAQILLLPIVLLGPTLLGALLELLLPL